MMHELTHVWQWQNDVFGPFVVMPFFATVEGIIAIFDHDAVYEPWPNSPFPGVEAMAERVENISRDYLTKSMGALQVPQIRTFVDKEVPFLMSIQLLGGGGALTNYVKQHGLDSLYYTLRAYRTSPNLKLWEVLEKITYQGELGQNFPNPVQ